jgi:hypothetical protein
MPRRVSLGDKPSGSEKRHLAQTYSVIIDGFGRRLTFTLGFAHMVESGHSHRCILNFFIFIEVHSLQK